jgi:hypothetical protein
LVISTCFTWSATVQVKYTSIRVDTLGHRSSGTHYNSLTRYDWQHRLHYNIL